jgi:hypothetical protein
MLIEGALGVGRRRTLKTLRMTRTNLRSRLSNGDLSSRRLRSSGRLTLDTAVGSAWGAGKRTYLLRAVAGTPKCLLDTVVRSIV